MKVYPSQWIYNGLTCRDVTDRASEYLDNRISILNKVRIGLHLEFCVHCRVYVKQVGLVSSALRSLPKVYPSTLNRLCLRQRFAARHAN